MPRNTTPRTPKLSFEQLTDRVCPANLTVTVTPGFTIDVQGDNATSTVRMTHDGVGVVTLTPSNGTTVNGSAQPVTFTNIANLDWNIDGQNGEDSWTFDNFYTTGTVRVSNTYKPTTVNVVEGQFGNLYLTTLGPIEVQLKDSFNIDTPGYMTFDFPANSSTVIAERVVFGSLLYRGSDEDDTLIVRNNCEILYGYYLDMLGGADQIEWFDMIVVGPGVMDTGDGDDILNVTQIDSQAPVSMPDVLNLGSGDDMVTVANFKSAGLLSIVGDDG
ncbi:MAG: hypothetical protein ACRCZF_09110, partial [Gemmataceae bacterium]